LPALVCCCGQTVSLINLYSPITDDPSFIQTPQIMVLQMLELFRQRYAAFATVFGLISAALLLQGCNPEEDPMPEPPPPEAPSYLVSYSLKAEYSQTLLVTFAGAAGFGDLTDLIATGMDIYTVRYNTVYQGDSVVASASFAVPKTDTNGRPPIVGACRGTIFADSEAPSRTSLFYGFEVFAAAGYATILPDYIGFGETSAIVHPYYNTEASSRATIDAMLAAEEIMEELGRETNGQRFLFGYSQGGGTAIATLQALETDPNAPIEITATSAGAGAYDINNVADILLQSETFDSPAFLAFLIYSYNEVTGWNRPLTDFFQEPYASNLPQLFDGSKDADAINAELTNTLADLFAPAFLTGIQDGTETQVRDALAANSVHDWAPQSPVRLYHSTGDEIIPYADSERTAQIMTQNGAPAVELVTAGNAAHANAVQDVLELTFPWFESLRTL